MAAWRLAEKAIRGFMPNPLYFLWGVWYRLWIRPLVPDIDAIPEAERAYYEREMLSTHHNPNRDCHPHINAQANPFNCHQPETNAHSPCIQHVGTSTRQPRSHRRRY